MKIDLHSHTTASDGQLTPHALIERATQKGVDVLSITDHDTIAAYHELGDLDQYPIKLIPGIEFSTQWRGVNLHILGLNLNVSSDILQMAVEKQTAARIERSEVICQKLSKLGLNVSLQEVQKLAGKESVGRPHFAQHLIDTGAVKDMSQAFKKYLGDGKPGDVKQFWAELPQIIEWINEAGGDAVIAHPCKYKMTRTKLVALVDEFKSLGGCGIEVISGNQPVDEVKKLARICNENELFASSGSDFHHPDTGWREIGLTSPMPKNCQPIWERWLK
jgi:predicted metal-dependent phosphoesterase TrpH